MGGTVSEPDWKADFRSSVDYWAGGDDARKAKAFEALLSHIEDAYQRGLMAGLSRAGYTTRRKGREAPCMPTDAPSAGTPSPASSTEAGEP